MTEEKDNVYRILDKAAEKMSDYSAIITYGTPVEKMLMAATEAFTNAFVRSISVLTLDNRKEDLIEFDQKMRLFLETIEEELDLVLEEENIKK